MSAAGFARRLVAWHEHSGRHGLPWQGGDAYRVWLSEVMLQQTQVATAAPYYERFVARFPGVRELAGADLDEVLALWSGLGYYARARNLLAAARIVCEVHGGELPDDIESLMALPGIGRSTAGAVLSLAFGQRHPVLDGNVKRVLARHAGIDGWPGGRDVETKLWALAERLTPRTRTAAYTQAVMDLGATVCTRARPRCGACPLASDCVALHEGRIAELPAPRPRKAVPVRSTVMLLLRDGDGAVLLERRPPHGIWGGLWCLPETADEASAAAEARERYGIVTGPLQRLAPLRHAFTHFVLDIAPLAASVDTRGRPCGVEGVTWASSAALGALGLPAPVRGLVLR